MTAALSRYCEVRLHLDIYSPFQMTLNLSELLNKRWWAQILSMILLVIRNVYVILIIIFLGLHWLVRDVWWVSLLSNFTPYFFFPALVLLPVAILYHDIPTVLRLLLVLAIAISWFGPYFLPKSIPAPTAPVLRIATLNADVANTHIEKLVDWIRASGADLVFIQETPEGWFTENGSAYLNDIYPYSLEQPYQLNGDTKVFLSRFPIVEASQFKLTKNDRFVHQYILVQTPLGELATYNVHLMPNYGDTPRFRVRVLGAFEPLASIALSYDESERTSQIANIREQLAKQTIPYIIAGDFNTSNFSPLYDQLASDMTDSFREAGSGFGMTWPDAGAGGIPAFLPPLLRLDYIWHSTALRAVRSWVDTTDVGSDHFPVLTELTSKS